MEKNSFYYIGLRNKTDKVLHHRYDRFYEVYLNNFREKEIALLEIGSGKNFESFNMWHEYFPQGRIFCMDIDEEKEEEWGQVFKGDQSSPSDLFKLKDRIKTCDIIIDDGSHVPEHQINTFVYLFKNLLNPGGIYIIEDIECSFWNPESEIYGYKSGSYNILNFLSLVPYEVNSEFSGIKNRLEISSITYGHNCIIMKKKTEEEILFTQREYRFKNLL